MYRYVPRVYVSFTTSPSRIEHIKPMLDSILRQSVQVEKIIVNLPHVFKRDNTTFSSLPAFLHHPKIYINKCEDVGPATKILPIIDLPFINDEDIVFSVDDDHIYPSNILETYIDIHKYTPNSVLTGTSYYPNNKNTTINGTTMYQCELLEGFSCVLYCKSFLRGFDTKELSNEEYPKYCFLSDDLILSNHILKRRRILAFTMSHPVIKQIKSLDYGFKNDALHKGANGQGSCNLTDVNCNVSNYNKCKSYLKLKDKYNFQYH